VLDFLELPQVLRIRAVSRTISRRVQDCLTVLSLNGLEDMRRDWVNPASLSCLTRFKNVKTLHWYVGQVHSDEDEELTPRSMWWGESLMVWTYLLAHLKVDDVTITEGPKTDEQGLEGLWSHVLPACAPQLQRLAMSFEGYNDCLENEDHPPINLKKFSVMLAKEKPFPNLRELHMEMGSMSMNEQRSLVLGIGRSGLLARLEALTLGGGTSTYNRPPPKGGAGGELARLLQKQGAPQLRLLWIQRLDIWDDFDGFARVLNSPRCPALCELYLDLTLDCDDVGVLAQCLHLFPACLTTLGVLVVCIKSRTPTGEHEPCRPNLALHALANAMVAHPRENLQCLDLSLHVDPQNGVDSSDKDQDCIPILRALASGAAPKLRHLQLPNTYLERAGFDAFIEVLPSLKSLQTIDLSANTISVDGAQRLISALRSMPAVYEVVCEDCVSSIKDREEMEVLCSSLPSCHFLWKSVQETAAEEDLDDQSFSSNEDAPMMDADGVDEEGEEDEEEVDFAEGNGLVHAHPAPWWAVGGHDMAHDWDVSGSTGWQCCNVEAP
jgi:hypothetical protein